MQPTQETNFKLVFLMRVGIWTVALYLIGAATLKVLGNGQEVKLFSPLLISFATLVELFVGVLLLTNFSKRLSWILGVSLFISLTLFSANTAISGVSDCGCFGPLKVNPWITTCFNVTAVLLLLLARLFSPSKGIISEIFFVIVVSIAGLGLASFASGAYADHVVAYLKGDLVYLAPSFTDIGLASPGEKRLLRIRVYNLTSQPVKVVGGSVACSCMVVNELPPLIPANGSVEVGIEIKINNQPGLFGYTFQLFTDYKKKPNLTGAVTGKISELAPE